MISGHTPREMVRRLTAAGIVAPTGKPLTVPELRAALGEPFLSHFDPAALQAELRARGFSRVEDLSVLGLVRRFVGQEAARAMEAQGRMDRGGHVLFASTDGDFPANP